jgi:hypothetical protein
MWSRIFITLYLKALSIRPYGKPIEHRSQFLTSSSKIRFDVVLGCVGILHLGSPTKFIFRETFCITWIRSGINFADTMPKLHVNFFLECFGYFDP